MYTFIHTTISTFRVDGIPNQYTLAAMNALVYKIRVNYRFREIIKEHFNKTTMHPLMTFAKKTAIGVGILKKPARIHSKEIQVVFLLAMEHKQNEQIGVLFEFFRHMAQNRSAIGRLAAVETEEEFVEVLIRISNSLES